MPKPLPFLPVMDDNTLSVRNVRAHDWVESSFFDSDERPENDFLGVSIDTKKITALFVLIFFVCTLFFVRSAYLQVIHGQGFALLAQRNKTKIRVLPARRGVIYDRSHKLLTYNIPNFILQIIPNELPKDGVEKLKIITDLSVLIHKSEGQINTLLASRPGYLPVRVVDTITYKDALSLDVAIANMSGVTLMETQQRQYDIKDAKSLSHVLGYTGNISEKELEKRSEYILTDDIGKEGLELYYEDALRGKNGSQEVEVDALGAEKSIVSEEQSIDGTSLQLAIDDNLQKESERALLDSLKKFNKKRGVVIATNPKNGEILAAVSLPAYDNNEFAKGITPISYAKLIADPDKPLFNRIFAGEYPSGSTIKPIVASAGLQEHIITKSTAFLSVGGLRIGEWTFPDWKAGGHGMTNVTKALAESVNTFFYIVGGGYDSFQGLGVDRLVSYFKKFGLGEKIGADVISEHSGFIPTPEWKVKTRKEPWYIGDTYHIAIGQGDVIVTPLQINEFTAYFANNGTSYIPHLVKALEPPKGSGAQIKPVVYRSHIVDDEVTGIVRDGLRQGVLVGSGRRLSTLPFTSAGKTGTAQWGVNKDPHAWFTGWAPYENPEIAVTVLIEEGEEGSRTAVPVAYDILKWYFSEGKKAGHIQELTTE